MKLMSNDPVVRLGEDPEGVHRARVAARRLRSDLLMFRPLLDRDWADALREEIGWLGRLLGPIRDAEVLGARIQQRVAAMVGLEPRSAKILLDGLESDRLAGRRRLLAGMRSRRYEARRAARPRSPGTGVEERVGGSTCRQHRVTDEASLGEALERCEGARSGLERCFPPCHSDRDEACALRG